MQVLLGLQSNALKFTRQGSVIIKVAIDKRQNGTFLTLSVEDTGIGISEQN